MLILHNKKKEKIKQGKPTRKKPEQKGVTSERAQNRPHWEENVDLRCEELEGKYSRQWKQQEIKLRKE